MICLHAACCKTSGGLTPQSECSCQAVFRVQSLEYDEFLINNEALFPTHPSNISSCSITLYNQSNGSILFQEQLGVFLRVMSFIPRRRQTRGQWTKLPHRSPHRAGGARAAHDSSVADFWAERPKPVP